MRKIFIKSIIASVLLMLVPGYIVDGHCLIAAILTLGIVVLIALK